MSQKFKEGDIVRVRSWDDMVEEFGYLSDGGGYTIDTYGMCFVLPMKFMCGYEYAIGSIYNEIFCNLVPLDGSPAPRGMISFAMLKLVQSFGFDASDFTRLLNETEVL